MFKFNSHLPKLFLKADKVKYGKGLRLIGWPFIFRFPKASVYIGDDVTINSNFFSNLLGLYQRTIIVAKNNSKISIGDRVGISGATIYAWSGIEIGDDTRIGANVKIIDTDFHPIDPEQRLKGSNSAAGTKPIVIGKNVFIGMNSLILKGARIGDNCVVGAGSVVSGTWENNCIIAGNPAKVIRKLEPNKTI